MFTLPSYVGIILKKDTLVLLVKRHNTDWASGSWNFPGGLLEDGETLLAAAIREAREEIGVTVDPNDLHLIHVLQVHKNTQNTKNILGFYFMATKWEGNPVNNEPDRHSEIGWFELNQLPEHITEHALHATQGIRNNTPYSTHGF